jgi:hypothetical protein
MHEGQTALRTYTVGRPQTSMRRRVPAGAVSDGYAVVKVIIGDLQVKRRASERSRPIDDRALMRGVRPIA